MQEKKFVLSVPVDLRWGDMDLLGHVNHVVYLQYVEQARLAAMRLWGLGFDGEEGPVVVNINCNYRNALRYPDAVESRLYLGKIGTTSIETYFEIVRPARPDGEPELLAAEGSATLVWIDYAQESPRPVPDALRQRLAALG